MMEILPFIKLVSATFVFNIFQGQTDRVFAFSRVTYANSFQVDDITAIKKLPRVIHIPYLISIQ